ncbi:ParA family protein, partial [Candidatus Poribacteria bacterium]|nr:ParA family protein [Candidatus Poribacteria bacterium]
MSVIAVDNQKGGVGKTTLTFNLAKGFAARGKRTLVIDNDPQANLTGALLDTPGKLVANIIAIY